MERDNVVELEQAIAEEIGLMARSQLTTLVVCAIALSAISTKKVT